MVLDEPLATRGVPQPWVALPADPDLAEPVEIRERNERRARAMKLVELKPVIALLAVGHNAQSVAVETDARVLVRHRLRDGTWHAPERVRLEDEVIGVRGERTDIAEGVGEMISPIELEAVTPHSYPHAPIRQNA